MLEKLYSYAGIGRPHATYPLEHFYNDRLPVKIIAMTQEEFDYMSGLQYMLGAKVNITLFQDFHDWAYSRQRDMTLNDVMANIACSYSELTDLMMSPYGDKKWEKIQLARRSPRLTDEYFMI